MERAFSLAAVKCVSRHVVISAVRNVNPRCDRTKARHENDGRFSSPRVTRLQR